jgi:tRNA-dihydrouridine synthase A
MLGLFQGQPGGKVWRRYLSQHAVKGEVKASVVQEALEQMLEAREHARQFIAQRPVDASTE